MTTCVSVLHSVGRDCQKTGWTKQPVPHWAAFLCRHQLYSKRGWSCSACSLSHFPLSPLCIFSCPKCPFLCVSTKNVYNILPACTSARVLLLSPSPDSTLPPWFPPQRLVAGEGKSGTVIGPPPSSHVRPWWERARTHLPAITHTHTHSICVNLVSHPISCWC